MLKGLRVPTHRVQAPGLYVLPWDDAWDRDRILAERSELADMALAQLQAKAVAAMEAELGRELTDEERATATASCALTEAERTEAEERHPVPRYSAGETRFDVEAIDQSPRGPARAWDYFRPGAEPTVFHLRRVGYQARMRIEAAGLRDKVAENAAWIKAGVEAITCGAETLWKTSADAPDLSDEWIDGIATSGEGGALFTIVALAEACKRYSRPLDAAEKGR